MEGSQRTPFQLSLFPKGEEQEKEQQHRRVEVAAAPEGGPASGLGDEELMEQVLDSENLRQAYRRVKANRGAAGVDGVSVHQLAAYLREHWSRIRQELFDGRYQPQPVRRVVIAKPAGGERLLGIPTALDRLIQQALLQVLGPRFDPHFSESSFGFRPGRSAHGAVRQIQRFVREGYRMAVDIDLVKFFDRVQHDLVMARVARKVRDKRVLSLLGRYLRAGVLVEGGIEPSEKGVPQGGPISPLLANVLLDDLDKELEKRELRFARYADDVLIVVRSQRAAERVMSSLVRWLQRKLRLSVNKEKSQVARISRCSFLGFSFQRGKIWLAPRSYEQVQRRIRELTRRRRGVSMGRRIRELSSYLRGWIGYFGLCGIHTLMRRLDSWIRRRLRACLWKQWKRPRTRIQKLLSLGVSPALAYTVGKSSKGPWRLSRTLNTHCALSAEWFQEQGLVSLHESWKRLAPLR